MVRLVVTLLAARYSLMLTAKHPVLVAFRVKAETLKSKSCLVTPKMLKSFFTLNEQPGRYIAQYVYEIRCLGAAL